MVVSMHLARGGCHGSVMCRRIAALVATAEAQAQFVAEALFGEWLARHGGCHNAPDRVLQTLHNRVDIWTMFQQS